MAVQIPVDVKNKIGEAADKYAFRVPYDGTQNFYDQIAYKHFESGAEAGYNLSQQKIKSFRKKLENITIDELLTNPKIVLDMFDKEFGLTLP